MGYNAQSAAIHTDIGTSSTVNSEAANAFASQFEGASVSVPVTVEAVPAAVSVHCDMKLAAVTACNSRNT